MIGWHWRIHRFYQRTREAQEGGDHSQQMAKIAGRIGFALLLLFGVMALVAIVASV